MHDSGVLYTALMHGIYCYVHPRVTLACPESDYAKGHRWACRTHVHLAQSLLGTHHLIKDHPHVKTGFQAAFVPPQGPICPRRLASNLKLKRNCRKPGTLHQPPRRSLVRWPGVQQRAGRRCTIWRACMRPSSQRGISCRSRFDSLQSIWDRS